LTAAQQNDLRGAFRVLQLDSVNVTARTYSTTSTSFVDITDLSITMTPQESSNKFLIFSSLNFGGESSPVVYFRITRNGTAIGSGHEGSSVIGVTTNASPFTTSFMFLDTPASASAQTFKIQVRVTGGTFVLNRRGATDVYNGASNLTVAEISA
jgi:hypothetical protein